MSAHRKVRHSPRRIPVAVISTDIELDFQLGDREAGSRDIAASMLATVPILEGLDTRPMEWVGAPLFLLEHF